MPKQRITPGSGLNPATGRVVRGGGDPFTPFTGNAAKGRLEQLARSLGGVGREATGFYRQQAQRQDEEDAKAGRQAFLKSLEEQQDVSEAIRQGRMRPGASKWFRWGVEAAAGEQAALRARDHFVSTKGEALKEATTLEEFDQLAGEAFDEYRETLDAPSEAFDNGFMPSYMAQIEQQRYAFATGIDGKLTAEFVENFAATQYEMLDGMYAFGGALADTGMGPEEDRGFGGQVGTLQSVGAAITADLDAAVLANPKMARQLKEAAVANLKALAARHGDMGFLELAKQIKVGPEEQGEARASLYSQFARGPNGLDQYTVTLADQLYRQDTQAFQIAEREKAREREQTTADVMRMFASGGDADPETRAAIEQRLVAMESTDPAGAHQIRGMLDSRFRYADQTVMPTYDRIRWGLIDGTAGLRDIRAATDELSQMDAERLIQVWEQKNKQEDDPRAREILTHSRVNHWNTKLGQRFQNKLSPEIVDVFAQQRAQAVFANNLLRRQEEILALMEENPNHPQLEQIYQQEANAALSSTLSSLNREIGDTFAEDGSLVGGEEARQIQPEEAATRFSQKQLRDIWTWQQQGILQGEDPEVVRMRNYWNSLFPHLPFGSDPAMLYVNQILEVQRSAGGS